MLTVFFFSLVFFLLLVGATHFRYCFFITSVVGVFPSRNNSLIYISIFPPPRGAAAQTDVAARVPPPPSSSSASPTPGEQWPATDIGNESVTPASYSCCENSALYLLLRRTHKWKLRFAWDGVQRDARRRRPHSPRR